MDSLKIDIINPKARELLRNLADLNLIAIREEPDNHFFELLEKLRSKEPTLSLEDITKEVEIVRAERYVQHKG